MSYRDPTPDELKDPMFERVWQAIKDWDIGVPKEYGGYMGATGNHVCAILDAAILAEDKGTGQGASAEAQGEIARRYAASVVEGLVKRKVIARYLADETDARDAIADAIKNALHEAASLAVPPSTGEPREHSMTALGKAAHDICEEFCGGSESVEDSILAILLRARGDRSEA